MDSQRAEKMVALAGFIAIAALFVLFVDMQIKRQILAEASKLREVIAGERSSRGSKEDSGAGAG